MFNLSCVDLFVLLFVWSAIWNTDSVESLLDRVYTYSTLATCSGLWATFMFRRLLCICTSNIYIYIYIHIYIYISIADNIVAFVYFLLNCVYKYVELDNLWDVWDCYALFMYVHRCQLMSLYVHFLGCISMFSNQIAFVLIYLNWFQRICIDCHSICVVLVDLN